MVHQEWCRGSKAHTHLSLSRSLVFYTFSISKDPSSIIFFFFSNFHYHLLTKDGHALLLCSTTLPYAWVGDSGKQCPEVCAYPFAVPGYMGGGGTAALRPPNGDVGIDGMISVIAHELAELSSNPLVNAWYAGEDPTAPTEIGDLCEGLYGTGGGGGYIGQVMRDGGGRTYNMNGRRGRKFLVQWIWSPVLKACACPNALD